MSDGLERNAAHTPPLPRLPYTIDGGYKNLNVMDIKTRLDRMSSTAQISSYKSNLAVLMEVGKKLNAFLSTNQDKSGPDGKICFRLQNMDPYDSSVMRT